MATAKPAQPDLTPCIAKAAERLAEAIDSNAPANACAWLDLLERLTKAATK